MKNQVESLYRDILRTTKEIKQAIMFSLADSISYLPTIPEDIKIELENLALIEGRVFSSLRNRGKTLIPVEDKEGCFEIDLDGERFVTHISKIDGGQIIKTAPIKQEPLPITKETTNSQTVTFENNKPEEILEEVLEDTSNEISNDDISLNNKIFEDDILAEENNTIETSNTNDEIQTLIENNNTLIENTPVITEPVIQEFVPEKATIIGGDYVNEPNLTPMSRADDFVEETRKLASEFVFDSYRMSVCHIGSKMEDMQFTIAPLKIQRYACPSVPIIVSVYYQGKNYTASSFDKNEDGRNIVNIDVGDYNFLCRGYFNDNGEFQSTIQTCKASAEQGDIINPISQQHSRPTGRHINNGHLKFRYLDSEGPGIIEIFPLDMVENEFLVMTRCSDFVEYQTITNKAYGLRRIIFYNDGVKSELVCQWADGYMEAEIVPL